MKTDTNTVLTFLKIASWIVFIGLCIETGAMLTSYIVTLSNPRGASNLYRGLDLSDLYAYSFGQYTALVSLLIAVSGLKAYVFYLLIKIFLKLNIVKPFSEDIADLVAKISYDTLSVALVGYIARLYADRLLEHGVNTSDIGDYWGDSGAYLMMAGVVFVIAQIFRKGIDLQAENELTV